MKFRKKPIVIEATQWFPGIEIDGLLIFKHMDEDGNFSHFSKPYISTLEGDMVVCPGDWVITGINGEKYPCKPDIFENTYEIIEEE